MKKPPQKVDYLSRNSIISDFFYCPTAQMAEFMFLNVVYRATVYRTGVAIKAERWAVFWGGRLVALTVRLVVILGCVYEYQERYFLLTKVNYCSQALRTCGAVLNHSSLLAK